MEVTTCYEYLARINLEIYVSNLFELDFTSDTKEERINNAILHPYA